MEFSEVISILLHIFLNTFRRMHLNYVNLRDILFEGHSNKNLMVKTFNGNPLKRKPEAISK